MIASSFFNDETARYLQQVAILFEVFGLLLIVIELRFKKYSDIIEAYIDRAAMLPSRESIISTIVNFYQKHAIHTFFISLIFYTSIVIAAYVYLFANNFLAFIIIFIVYLLIQILTVGTLLKSSKSNFSIFSSTVLLVISFIGACVKLLVLLLIFGFFYIIYIALILTLYSLRAMLNGLNWIADGKALGALGLISALLGISCEFYQVVELCLSDGCYWMDRAAPR